ncbi:hypothetical protein L4D06_09295 [Enterovibrio makurazakiensis]
MKSTQGKCYLSPMDFSAFIVSKAALTREVMVTASIFSLPDKEKAT